MIIKAVASPGSCVSTLPLVLHGASSPERQKDKGTLAEHPHFMLPNMSPIY